MTLPVKTDGNSNFPSRGDEHEGSPTRLHLWNDPHQRQAFFCGPWMARPGTSDVDKVTCVDCLLAFASARSAEVSAARARIEVLEPTPTERLVVWSLDLPAAARALLKDISVSNVGHLHVHLAKPIIVYDLVVDGQPILSIPVAVATDIAFVARVADKDGLRDASNMIIEAFEKARRR